MVFFLLLLLFFFFFFFFLGGGGGGGGGGELVVGKGIFSLNLLKIIVKVRSQYIIGCILSGSSLFVKTKKIFRQNNTIFFENYNLSPLDMYNGLSQVYCIKPDGSFY